MACTTVIIISLLAALFSNNLQATVARRLLHFPGIPDFTSTTPIGSWLPVPPLIPSVPLPPLIPSVPLPTLPPLTPPVPLPPLSTLPPLIPTVPLPPLPPLIPIPNLPIPTSNPSPPPFSTIFTPVAETIHPSLAFSSLHSDFTLFALRFLIDRLQILYEEPSLTTAFPLQKIKSQKVGPHDELLVYGVYSKTTEKNELVHVDEHLKVTENVLQGPNGMKAVAITVEDDLHVDEEEECRKKEKFEKDFH
ncbi:hypothetical protein L2E82_01851 [Cichorium intybus]|uniref:Uncharacterized protein n=1 Tax=Cichorium intybus TaxID=13427 RepID=A0ACB9H050_CICIN|nr:hypothetical protein L2E82_01851 [Cichorium intybus]